MFSCRFNSSKKGPPPEHLWASAMLSTHSGRVREAKRNDVQEIEALREGLIDDVLRLQEMTERRAETIRQLEELRRSSTQHIIDMAGIMRREQEIDNVRMQPLLESVKSAIRVDLKAIKARDKGWDKVCAKRAALDSAVEALAAARFARGKDGPKVADVAGITAGIKEDAALLMQLSGAVRLLQSVTATETFSSDPDVKKSLARAKDAVESIAQKRIALLENALDMGQAAEEDSSSSAAIAIETALIGVMASRAGSFVDVDELKPATPSGRSPRIILKEARAYLRVSVQKACPTFSRFPLTPAYPSSLVFSLSPQTYKHECLGPRGQSSQVSSRQALASDQQRDR